MNGRSVRRYTPFGRSPRTSPHSLSLSYDKENQGSSYGARRWPAFSESIEPG